jgi:hypothetical protein
MILNFLLLLSKIALIALPLSLIGYLLWKGDASPGSGVIDYLRQRSILVHTVALISLYIISCIAITILVDRTLWLLGMGTPRFFYVVALSAYLAILTAVIAALMYRKRVHAASVVIALPLSLLIPAGIMLNTVMSTFAMGLPSYLVYIASGLSAMAIGFLVSHIGSAVSSGPEVTFSGASLCVVLSVPLAIESILMTVMGVAAMVADAVKDAGTRVMIPDYASTLVNPSDIFPLTILFLIAAPFVAKTRKMVYLYAIPFALYLLFRILFYEQIAGFFKI